MGGLISCMGQMGLSDPPVELPHVASLTTEPTTFHALFRGKEREVEASEGRQISEAAGQHPNWSAVYFGALLVGEEMQRQPCEC